MQLCSQKWSGDIFSYQNLPTISSSSHSFNLSQTHSNEMTLNLYTIISTVISTHLPVTCLLPVSCVIMVSEQTVLVKPVKCVRPVIIGLTTKHHDNTSLSTTVMVVLSISMGIQGHNTVNAF